MLSAVPMWLDILNTAGVPCAPVNSVAEIKNDPQVAARSMIGPIADPVIGGLKVAGNPIKVSRVFAAACLRWRSGRDPGLAQERLTGGPDPVFVLILTADLIGTITLNQPAKRNALSRPLVEETLRRWPIFRNPDCESP
jgi:hypothetical protein